MFIFIPIANLLATYSSQTLQDEPTAGMDPGARRQLWEVIRVAKRSGTSVLLTSHSMGECEVLCDRIGIMCQGKLQCVGTPHYLKQK